MQSQSPEAWAFRPPCVAPSLGYTKNHIIRLEYVDCRSHYPPISTAKHLDLGEKKKEIIQKKNKTKQNKTEKSLGNMWSAVRARRTNSTCELYPLASLIE
jgi:hypothetical protein